MTDLAGPRQHALTPDVKAAPRPANSYAASADLRGPASPTKTPRTERNPHTWH